MKQVGQREEKKKRERTMVTCRKQARLTRTAAYKEEGLQIGKENFGATDKTDGRTCGEEISHALWGNTAVSTFSTSTPSSMSFPSSTRLPWPVSPT
jgi:hypothetical protein